ncbi:retinitis pigmentosa 1-like 1 protein [Bufo gargarizans]|uniref:retinitis pigmentosa 1-like 1 protein n=1 Tax=Bufo gargarizans TaxID=30331 RepID=UPI001CF5D569|nr:retinitis pigmentosa 1-like 1 protein [Bufo gargarizans]
MNPSTAEGYSAPPTCPEQPFPPVVRSHAVSEVTPAKKITFFKSGDPQFSGVRMAINRRSFKSFSALMDDLSNKVPLPFGVRTITTPRGTHNISRLEQLQDGGSYICSDKKYVQPMAGRKVGNQRASRPVSARRQGQHEDPDEEYSTTHFQQVPKVRKKLVLVRNGDPTIRRSIILNRKNARNIRTFLEDASDLLQYTVKRLYTVDGRRIENIQGVLQSAGILICARKEPFKSIHMEDVHKSDKLPGLRSHPSTNTEVMDNKKNANFGLKAKKSVIHPRPSSSTKTRLSLSSERSYPNGVNMSPLNSGFGSYPNMCPHGKSEDRGHSLLNDDIEKKVHVNKDGSLSVEMKVRFRLLNEETLQWSTQIKKSSTIGKAKCEELCLFNENNKMEEMNTENYSETDESFYPCDADSCSSKINDTGIEDIYCSHCGMQCQEYDIWKNPMHVNQQEDYVKRATWQTRSSASSTSSRHRFMCDEKTSVDSLHSVSSEEYTEHVVHRSSHYSETKENGDTVVTYSTVSQCASRSGRSTVASNVDAASDTEPTKRGKSRNKSRSSLKSQGSLQKQQSQLSEEQHSQRSHDGSFEECLEASATPCSGGENCSQRVSVVSQSSLHSIKSQSRMLKRNSMNTKSFASSLSYNEEDEETHQCSCKGSLKNMQGLSIEMGISQDSCGSEPAEDTKSSHHNEMHDKMTENALSTDPVKSSLADYDRHSTGGSSRSSRKSKSSSKKSVKVNGHNGDDTLCNSPCLSSISKQNNERVVIKQESLDICDNISESDATLSQSKRRSFTEHQEQSFQSTRSGQSMSSITESVQPNFVQDQHQILNHQESCDKSLSCTEKSDDRACIKNKDSECSPSISRASSKSLSSKFNSASCQENEHVFNASSRVSSISETKSIVKSSSEKCDQNSSPDTARSMSQEEEPVNDNVVADSSSQTEALEMNCIHSPSPPEGKPTHKHLRLAQLKLSSTSIFSEKMKTMNGEQTVNSRTSTPGSKEMLASRTSTETCKKTKTVTSHNSGEDIHSTKKRKNSSSSSKRKLKGEPLDAENNINSELIPSALPNVTPEEVVNEWLRKIPSQAMVVDYEVEECQKKTQTEVGKEASKTDIYKVQEEEDLHGVSVTKEHNSNEAKKEISQDENCINNANDVQDSNAPDGKYNDESVLLSKVAANNVKNERVLHQTACDKKSLPNNIQTSVQIMKALLTPTQESKFDRSNSLPEVSQTMRSKLSNSAIVLISCLASLQLLDEGQTEITKNTNDFKKTKYFKLLNILQALWTEVPTNKSITNSKSRKQYSRDDELTPVSSSGVDINSGFEGSGDGSLTGGGDHIAANGRPEEGKLSTGTKDVDCMQCCQENRVISGENDAENEKETTNEVDVASFAEGKSCAMDENMNEKKLDSDDSTPEVEVKEETKEEGSFNSVNNVNHVECIETVDEHRFLTNNSMNILSHSGEPKFSEPNSTETNNINSSSDCPSTVISTSDSNGNKEDKQGQDVDPVWVLKLLKKIEKEFMTHYVDAMNEFKVRWNLEDNENLDEMIAELKNEVSQRIQRSISNELKSINTQTGSKVPRPPVEGSRRNSSMQAEERRRRLQTMQRVSIYQYANGENRGVGTNDISCETDEEDLSFSASFGDDGSGQPNNDFCPCEKCILQKRALKLAKPQAVAINAPIIKAFDLQQILRLKRENDDPENDASDGVANPLLTEEREEPEPSIAHDCSTENEEGLNEVYAGEEIDKEKSDISSERGKVHGQEVKSVTDECEGCDSSDFQSSSPLQEKESVQLESNGLIEEINHVDDLEDDSDKNSAILKDMGVECPDAHTSVCENNENDDEHSSDGLPTGQQLTNNQDEKNESEENESEINKTDEVHIATDKLSEDEDHIVDDETTNAAINAEEDIQAEDTEVFQTNGSYLNKSCLVQCSLITQNGSDEDAKIECKEDQNVGETSPKRQSDSSSGKKSQMYPDSSSEDEDTSLRGSPVSVSKNETIGQVYANNKESFEECDNKSKKGIDEDIIDQDDLDF